MDEIEFLLFEDARAKRAAGRGVFHRASRLRKNETVVTPTQRMNAFDRKYIVAPGPCTITKLEDMKMKELMNRIKNQEIPIKEEIEALPMEQGQKVVAELRRLYTNEELMVAWKFNSKKFNDFVNGKYRVRKTKYSTIIIGELGEMRPPKTGKPRGPYNKNKDKNKLNIIKLNIKLNK
jgi:hypothetical protein